MHVLFLFAVSLLMGSSGYALAQTRPSPSLTETRYFTSIDGLMNGDADVLLRETRQGKNVTAAVLDVCYPTEKGSNRKDRFVANLTVNGPAMTGATQTLGGKLPVEVKLFRKQTGDTYDFRGQISIGTAVTEVASKENSDLSEREFRTTSEPADQEITPVPVDFTRVSPEAVGVRVKLESALFFLKSLKDEEVEVDVGSLPISCDALRTGEQTINLTVDPDRAAAVIARAKATPGVVEAGWTSGSVEMDRTIRFAAKDWRDGAKINKSKIATTISNVLNKSLSASPSEASWNVNTGKLELTFKRPSQIYPALGLTENIQITALVSRDKPGASDQLMLWVSSPVTTTVDEGTGPKLNLSEGARGGGERGEVDQHNDNSSSVEALAKEFKGQRWDADRSVWK